MTAPQHDIIPRDLRFGIAEQADRAWFGGDPVKTAIVDGFAALLPEGERFFIRSLKHYAEAIDDPGIRAGIQGYAIQEAFHTREHEAYNAALRALGHDVDAMEERARHMLGAAATPMVRLLATCAIEQITYSLSRFFLRNPDLMAQAAPAYRRLWRWHALEELEHSAVALRVWHAMPTKTPRWQRYLLRISVLNAVLVRFHIAGIANALALLRGPDGRVPWRVKGRLAWQLLVAPGFLQGLVIPCLAYLRPGYEGGGGEADAGLVALGRRLLEEDGVTA